MLWKTLSIAAAFAVVGIAAHVSAQEQEWEKSTPYYEDDAWYDVSEWLDGNDYNPTDEKFGRWDDEVYDSDTSTDRDNDRQTTTRSTTAAQRSNYGYRDDNNRDPWFYDYWNPGYWHYDDNDAATYEVAYYYYDFDGDGLYDSYTSFYDWNQDGIYEDVSRHVFRVAETGNRPTGASGSTTGGQASAQDKPSASQTVQGAIQNKKTVAVRGVQHVVAELKSQDGKSTVVDLGPQSKLQDLKLAQGDQITVSGHTTKAGDKMVLVARAVTVNEKRHEIDRQPRPFEGTIVETRSIKVRGQDHTLAVVNLKDGKQRLIDLGRSDALQQLDLKKDAHVIVRGVPIKVRDQQMVMGHTVEARGKKVSVNRQPNPKT